jgi:hypothetical protein
VAEVEEAAKVQGLTLRERVDMPANNYLLHFEKEGAAAAVAAR